MHTFWRNFYGVNIAVQHRACQRGVTVFIYVCGKRVAEDDWRLSERSLNPTVLAVSSVLAFFLSADKPVEDEGSCESPLITVETLLAGLETSLTWTVDDSARLLEERRPSLLGLDEVTLFASLKR